MQGAHRDQQSILWILYKASRAFQRSAKSAVDEPGRRAYPGETVWKICQEQTIMNVQKVFSK